MAGRMGRRVRTRRLFDGNGGRSDSGSLEVPEELLGLLRSTVQQLPPRHVLQLNGLDVAFLHSPLDDGLDSVALLQLHLSDGGLSFDLHIQDVCSTTAESTDNE